MKLSWFSFRLVAEVREKLVKRTSLTRVVFLQPAFIERLIDRLWGEQAGRTFLAGVVSEPSVDVMPRMNTSVGELMIPPSQTRLGMCREETRPITAQ